ncbi:hypothetical protein D3C72_1688060 [compost metagenome]
MAQHAVEPAGDLAVGAPGAQSMVGAHHRREERLDPGPAAQRPNMLHLTIAEDHATDAVTGVERHPGGQRRQLRRRDRLEAAPGAEIHGHALVHQQQRRPVALLGEGAHKGLAVAQRGAPVEVAQIVTGNVAAQFIEAQATATQT